MKTLLTLFGQERLSLETEIEKTNNVEQAVKLVQNRLDRIEKVYLGDLNISQVRLASLFLETLRQSLATLTATHSTQIMTVDAEKNVTSETKLPSSNIILKLLQGVICLGILGSLFSLTDRTPGAWMGILLTAVLIGLEVALQLEKKTIPHNIETPQLQALPPAIVQVDSQVLLDNLSDALRTIDEAVGRA